MRQSKHSDLGKKWAETERNDEKTILSVNLYQVSVVMRTPILNSVLSTVLVFLVPVSSFNLEPRIAIVKTGPPGSYFGYSVAQHQIVDRNSLDSVGLVGAPRDNSTQPGTER